MSLPPPPRILIKGARALTLVPAQPQLVGVDIRIEQGRIVAMASNLSSRGVDRVIPAHGMIAMPGMVQAHVHVCQTLGRGRADELPLLTWLQERVWPMEAALDPDMLRAAARLGMAELLLGGTTTVLDMGTVHHTDVLFEEARNLGLRYTGGKTIMDHGHGFPPALRETAEVALQESVRLCDKWNNTEDGRLRYAFSPRFALCCSEAVLTGCVREARARGALLHTHASENSDEVQLIRERTGRTNVEYLHHLGFSGHDVLLAHGVWLTAKEQRLLRESGTHIVHCPSSNLKLASGIARIDELLAAGIDVALGADGAPCNNGLDAFMEMRLAALLHKVRGGASAVPAAQALHLATRGGALAMGLTECGSLALGQQADVILLDLNKPHAYPDLGDLASRVVYAAQRSDVHTVLCQGRVVVSEGVLQTASVPDILQDAQRAAQRLQHVLGWEPEE